MEGKWQKRKPAPKFGSESAMVRQEKPRRKVGLLLVYHGDDKEAYASNAERCNADEVREEWKESGRKGSPHRSSVQSPPKIDKFL